jgi:hypothetical protein
VSTHGFYLQTQSAGLLPWSWGALVSAAMTARSSVHLQGLTAHGKGVSWLLRTPWAELVFVLWALARHPQHPQLLTGSWLPPGWVEHARHRS